MVAPRGNARDRFITEAARLFAERGYARTSVADIQQACGLTIGSGALYKHFPAKKALLDAVIERHLATMTAGNKLFTEFASDNVAETLTMLADAMFASMRRDRDILRLTLRDLDAFPELLEQVWTALRDDVYHVFVAWLTEQSVRRTIPIIDPPATAAVLLASLTYPPILDALIGHTIGDIDHARYRSAWVRHALNTIELGTIDDSGRAI